MPQCSNYGPPRRACRLLLLDLDLQLRRESQPQELCFEAGVILTANAGPGASGEQCMSQRHGIRLDVLMQLLVL